MRICPNPKCGKTIENDKAKFCRYCGTELPIIPEPTVHDEVELDEVVHDSDEGIVLAPSPATDNSPDKTPMAEIHPSDGIPLGFADDANISGNADNSPDSYGHVNTPGHLDISNSPNIPLSISNSSNLNQPYAYKKKPDNYLVWAILSTLFCCFPFGICAIVCSSNVNSLYASGDYIGAQKSSANAKKWSIIAAIVGLIALSIIIIVNLATSRYGAEESPLYEGEDTTAAILDYYEEEEEDYYVDLLRSGITEYKKELPEIIEEGVTIVDIELNEACLLYVAQCDESIIDIDDMNDMKSVIREQIKSSLIKESSNNDELRQLLNNCKKAKRGIGYKYIGDRSGDVCTVMVSYTSL